MDEETAKELQGVQDQLTTLLNRKRKREDIDLENEVNLRWRLLLSKTECSGATTRIAQESDKCAKLSKENKKLQAKNEQLEKPNKEHRISHKNSDTTINALKQEIETLRVKLKELEKYETVSKNVISIIKKSLSLALGAVSEVGNDKENDPSSCRLARR